MCTNPWVLLETCVCYTLVTEKSLFLNDSTARSVMTKKKSRALRSKFHEWRDDDYDALVEVSNFLAM